MNGKNEYVLGIDLGSASLGWALIKQADGGPCGILATGVRIFDPGVDGQMDRGMEESKNRKRREARLQRRQIRRRAARRRELFVYLQRIDLLPSTPPESSANKSQARHDAMNELDQNLWSKWKSIMEKDSRVIAGEHVLPYYLRSRALQERLEPYELGRALYHLGQRRGYKSNRKAEPKKDEKPGEVQAGISELGQEIELSGAKTLGEYYSMVDPNVGKIRRRWTERRMFTNEFEKIWDAQAPHHPTELTLARKVQVADLLFFQRPLQDNEHLIGECELEPREKRAPLATLAAQRFRLLQRVNDLRIEDGTGVAQPLTSDQRKKIVDRLETEEKDPSFASLMKLLGFKKGAAQFTHERGGEKNCRGNRTARKMRAAFGERWESLSDPVQNEIVEEWRRAEDKDDLAKRGVEKWGLTQHQAEAWSSSTPEPGYCGFSSKALSKLLPLLESGLPLQTAIKQVYPAKFGSGTAYERLPPCGTVRNPAIQRAMSELRKVVNAIIRKYGKPQAVRIELARDLKKNREQRKEIWQKNRGLEKQRRAAAESLVKAIGNPSRADIEKLMLAEECGYHCPYTGKAIGMHSLFTAPEFQVEHILPLSRFPDSSFNNKTLCHVSANLDKSNRTPYEAFHAAEEQWAQILERVRKFNNPVKLRRFQLTPDQTEAEHLLHEFTERQLNDTRYASKLAAQFIAKLYGGRDEEGARKVFASSGTITATLRTVWGLNSVLSAGPGKSRDDHRHHAVDAVVIGLTSERIIRQMSLAAGQSRESTEGKPHRPFRTMQAPWPDFVPSIRTHIEQLKVSHRPDHKLSGALHDETLYGRQYKFQGKDSVNVRKSLAAITASEIQNIVDDAVRAAVEAKLLELGGDNKKLNSIAATGQASELPYLESSHGKRIPIRRVRIRKSMTPRRIGAGPRERHVAPGDNHHMEIFADLNERGKEIRWDFETVSLLDATERLRTKQPVVVRKHPAETNTEFKFSLMGKDILEVLQGERPGLYQVRSLWASGIIVLVAITDARIKTEMGKDVLRLMPDTMRKLGCRKVTIDLLGVVHPVND